jgi:hypothetical protein
MGRGPLVEVEQLIGLAPAEPTAADQVLEASPLAAMRVDIGIEVNPANLPARP